jgi:hypothetical protein
MSDMPIIKKIDDVSDVSSSDEMPQLEPIIVFKKYLLIIVMLLRYPVMIKCRENEILHRSMKMMCRDLRNGDVL